MQREPVDKTAGFSVLVAQAPLQPFGVAGVANAT
jgi:hypothetical protein